MKKISILVFVMAMTTMSYAQKGSLYIGGLAGFGSNSTEDKASGIKQTNSNWAVSPEIGTFLKDDIQLGIAFGFSGTAEEFDGEEIMSTSLINPTVYGRKFFKITDNFSTFAGLYLGYSSGSTTDNSDSIEVKMDQSGFNARLGIGIAYALSPRFTAVGQFGLFGYSTVTHEVDGEEVGTESSMDFGVNTVGGSTLTQGNGSGSVFNIGIYYTFKEAK